MEKIKEIYIEYRFLVFLISSILISGIVLVFVVIPQVSSYIADQNKISSLQNQIMALRIKATTLNTINQTELEKNLQVVFTVLPSTQDPPMGMNTLAGLIKESGLTLKEASFVGQGQTKTSGSYQINITVLGSVDLIRQFLINLQNAPLIYQVQSIGIHFQTGSFDTEAEIPIAIFYQSTLPTKVSLTQDIPKLNQQEQQLLARLSGFVSQSASLNVSTSSATTNNVQLGKNDPFQ